VDVRKPRQSGCERNLHKVGLCIGLEHEHLLQEGG
jgi:hypothetical protein